MNAYQFLTVPNMILLQERELREHFRKLGFYREVPTPELLREAQQVYHTLDWPQQFDDDGDPLPCPPSSSRDEILNPSEIKELDDHALQVQWNLGLDNDVICQSCYQL